MTITSMQDKLTVMLTEEQIQKKIIEIANNLNDFYNGEGIVVVCVLKGAVMFMTDLVKHLNMPLQLEFIRLSSYGNSQKSSGVINALEANLPDLSGKNILIVEDIIDTGFTADYLIKFMNHKFTPKSVKFCSLLNKPDRRQVAIEADFYGFKIDDKFVVGYGLDDEGYYRNLPFIGYKEV